EAISSAGQGSVWNEIQAYRSEMKYNSNIAPTQSYFYDVVDKFKELKIEPPINIFFPPFFFFFFLHSHLYALLPPLLLRKGG
ncbi:unnamed protein product, partial [marine sediment metagenome]